MTTTLVSSVPSQPAWTAATKDSLEWFSAARFGLFLHWGLYAIPAGVWQGRQVPYIGEWIQHEELIPRAEYEKLTTQFTMENFDARSWVATAKAAGMRYVVLTAKHHEGFALWDSRCDDFNSVRSVSHGRDVVRELAEACREGGLRLGLYYSHCVDWHEAHGGNLPDDIKEASRLSGQGRMWGNDWDFPLGNAVGFAEYLQRKVEPQLTELLTGYGEIALIWFDTPTASLQPEQARRLRDLIKHHQPGCLVGGRIGHGFQDFDSLGDNQVPAAPLSRPGETCMTLNDTWGYKAHDHAWAAPADVIGLLAACTAANANLLLNVGPMADGRLPEPALACLTQVGTWLAKDGCAIHGCGAAGLPIEPAWGTATRSGSMVHVLVTDNTCTEITLPLPNAALESVRLSSGQHEDTSSSTSAAGQWLTVALPPALNDLPRRIELRFAMEPQWDQTPDEDPAGSLVLPARAAVGPAGAGWHGWAATGDSASWQLRCRAAGRFRVEVLCGGERYGEWYGGHAVTVRTASGSVAGIMQNGTRETGRAVQHYPLFSVPVGELDLLSGAQSITLHVTATAGSDSACFPCIRLRRIATSEG